jgi:hypothetical protein
MKLTRTKHSLLIRRAMDKAFDAYLEWRERSETVQIAYSMWTAAPSEDVAVAFRAYVVALDREENAANRYCALVEEVRNIVDPGFAEDASELETSAGV